MWPWAKVLTYRFGGLAALLAAAACAKPPDVTSADLARIDFASALKSCCANTDKYPLWFINSLERNSISIVPLSRGIVLRKSYLQDDAAAEQALLGSARPLDLILISNKSRLSGAVGDGYFGHSAVYTGTEADLRALGVWDHPAVAKFHERIRAGGIAIESIDQGVRLSNTHMLMEADSAALFRTTGVSRSRQKAAIIQLFTEIGKPFDNNFDLDTSDAIFCTELINDALPELNMPVRVTYGRRVIWPDEVATGALLEENGFRFEIYLKGSPVGWREESWQAMAARILQEWPDVLVAENPS
ncbi:MAG TPA: hypothetical protein ENK28_05235 [Aliiroseovarius sp.]|nr:hypothetical protein [Aliiroseovarius sp.]